MNYRFSKAPKEVIEAALKTLGLESSNCPQDTWADVSAIEWFNLCSSLFLSPDCISYGYSRREHKARIRTAWENGELTLPMTLELVGLLKEIKADRRTDLRWCHRNYGFRLKWKVRLHNIRDDLRRFSRNRRNGIHLYSRLENNFSPRRLFLPSSKNVATQNRELTAT